jgi:RHS repeat-associated protein
VRHPDFSTIVTQYSDTVAPYYVEFRTDENLKTTHYMRDDNHRVRRIEYPDYPVNGYEEFTYNNFDQILTHTMTSGGIEHFEYDNRGLKTLSWPPSTSSDLTPVNNPTQYFYYGGPSGPGNAPEVAQPDLIDRLRRVIDPRGNSTWYEYNKRGLVTKVTHHDGKYTQSDYNADGTLAWTEDELRHRTTYTYDDYKRVTETKNHLNETVTNSYAPWNGFGPLSHTTSSVYRVTSQMQKKTDYDYDNNFRRKRTTQAPEEPNDTATTTYTYDEVGNLETVTEPNGQPGQSHPGAHTTFGYNNRNRQETVTNNTPPETTTVVYDFVGNKKSETRHDGTLRSWDYDAMNRLWHAYDWRTNVTPTANQTTTYDRDHAGNASFITDTKGAIYSFVYDALNRKESATNPSDNTIPARTEGWHYDIAGNLDGYTNPDQKHRHFHYDNRNRQDHSWWDGGVAVGQDIWTGYDEASRVTSVITKSGETPITTVAFGYDHANRKIWEDQTVAGQQPGELTKTRRVTTDLDGDGKRLNLDLVDPPLEGGELIFSDEMSGSGRYTLTYEYTQRNQLKKISGGAEEQWAFNYVYDRSGNMTTREAQYHGGTSSTNCPSQNYDELNRPTTWEQIGPNGFHALSHYQYDQVNRESATWRDEEDQKGERFTYEPTNQLATAAYNGHVANGPPSDATRSVSYAYTPDKLNRSRMTTDNSGTVEAIEYSPNALNQYTSTGGNNYSYDNNFNLTHVAGFNGVYDAANRLITASNGGSGEAQQTVAGFIYDGLGRCVRRTFNNVATIFVFDGWKPIAEFDAWNEFHAWNVYGPGPDEILLRQHVKYGYVRFHLDRHGNVAFLVDDDGWVQEKYVYDAFGQPTVTTLAGQNARSWSYYGHDFLFQGREYIRELGIYDYRNRFYLPATGRFLQSDPAGFAAGDMNLFRYCGDDPVDLRDPLGLEPGDPFGSPFDAALDVHNFINPTSISRNREYGSVIYRLNGQYFATEPRLGSGRDSPERNRPPDGATRVGDYHSHGDYSRAIYNHRTHKFDAVRAKNKSEDQWGSDDFSKKDKREYDRLAKNNPDFRGYLGTPSGQMRVHNPVRGKPDDSNAGKNQRDNDAQTRREPTANKPSDMSNAPSAAQVDALHQATGVPSLGAEAVNFAPGKP